MSFQSLNPFTQSVDKTFDFHTEEDYLGSIDRLDESFRLWSGLTLHDRLKPLSKLSDLLLEKRSFFAKLMAVEMGKPVNQGEAEIKKCSLLCRYYLEHAPSLLNNFMSPSLFVQALGPILGIMPWNFPFWQVFRFAIPNLIVGNTVLIKHAPNVPQCADAIKHLFKEAEVLEGVFDSLFLTHDQIAHIISLASIKGVSLTGSERAGRSVAQMAGQALKPVVLELGGSDPFIVCEDADLDLAVSAADTSRCLNAGQTCISAKRFIIHKNLVDPFLEKLAYRFDSHTLGNPLHSSTTMGPLARLDLKDQLSDQVQKSIQAGAKRYYHMRLGDDYSDCFYPPTILTHVTREMPVFSEETFGPVAVVVPFSTDHEALNIANDTAYGLGASVWCSTKQLAMFFAQGLECGNVFINGIVKSSSELPFGGIKNSGFGRELGLQGLLSFVNLKTVGYFIDDSLLEI